MNRRIPNRFHFCYGLTSDCSFGLLEYLAIESARQLNQPEQIVFHCHHEPEGAWWDAIRPHLTLRPVSPPTEIFGNPVMHYAHQSDIIRMRALLEEGGVYIDIDTLCLRPYHELRDYPCVLGRQGQSWGLCNAVILAEPESIFLRTWMESYRTFSASRWDEHSVRLPLRLAGQPDMKPHLQIMPPKAFFHPLWNQMEVLLSSDDRLAFEDSYSVHYWETITRKRHLSAIDIDHVKQAQSNFGFFARRILSDEFLEAMRGRLRK